MVSNTIYESYDSYGTIEAGAAQRNIFRPKTPAGAKILPWIVMVVLVGGCLVGFQLAKDENQVDMVRGPIPKALHISLALHLSLHAVCLVTAASKSWASM